MSSTVTIFLLMIIQTEEPFSALEQETNQNLIGEYVN